MDEPRAVMEPRWDSAVVPLSHPRHAPRPGTPLAARRKGTVTGKMTGNLDGSRFAVTEAVFL